MAIRREYEFTEEQLASILDACKPVACMQIGTHVPRSPQQLANAAWEALGKKLGFDHMTVKSLPDKGQYFFTAEDTADVKGKQQDRVAEHEENTPITGGVDLDDESVPEPAFRPAAVVDPYDCMADYIRTMGAAISERDPQSPLGTEAVRCATQLLPKLRDYRDHQDRVIKSISPTTEERLAHAASVAVDATEKVLASDQNGGDIPNSYVEETHASLARCPQCAETFNVREVTNGETRREGKHTVYCIQCEYEFVIVTSVARTYTSPAIITDDA